jgi:protein involved in polysaccharide export with SLBB domain
VTGTATFSNVGAQPLTVQGVSAPSAPFTIVSAPPAGSVINPGDQFEVTVTAKPDSAGVFGSDFVVQSDGGNKDVMVTASAS